MIIPILFGIGFSFAMTQSIQWHLRWSIFNRKPFNCATCLAGWAGIIAYFTPTYIVEPLTVFLACNWIYYLINVK